MPQISIFLDVTFTTSHHPILWERYGIEKNGASFIYADLIAIVDDLAALNVTAIRITANNSHNCHLDIYKVEGKRHKKRTTFMKTEHIELFVKTQSLFVK